jgi:hypothetical protein
MRIISAIAINLDITEVSFARKIIKTVASLRRKRQFLHNAIKIIYLNKTKNTE